MLGDKLLQVQVSLLNGVMYFSFLVWLKESERQFIGWWTIFYWFRYLTLKKTRVVKYFLLSKMLHQPIYQEANLPSKDLNVALSTTPFPEGIFFIQRPISPYRVLHKLFYCPIYTGRQCNCPFLFYDKRTDKQNICR